MPKRLTFALIMITLLAVTGIAHATPFAFDDYYITLDVPADWPVIMTRDTLDSQFEALNAMNTDAETMKDLFDAEGILLMAVDSTNDRTFVLSCLKTVDSEMYFDLNEQDSDMRKEYRTGHTNGSAYGLLGYKYHHAAWTNYSNGRMRFLCTEYTLMKDGAVDHYGYQRRTIRNGYTYTLDLQVKGRQLKTADEKALEKLMDTFRFVRVLPLPQLPARLSISAEPPASTANGTFTVKGTSLKKAEITVTAISLTNASSTVYQETASSSGAFSVKVTLPSQGIYSIVISAKTPESLRSQFTYTVRYQPN